MGGQQLRAPIHEPNNKRRLTLTVLRVNCSCFPIFDEQVIIIPLFGKTLHLSSIIFSFRTLKNVGKDVIL